MHTYTLRAGKRLRPSGILYMSEAAYMATLMLRWMAIHSPLRSSCWWPSATKFRARGVDVAHYRAGVDDISVRALGAVEGSVLSVIVDRNLKESPNYPLPEVDENVLAAGAPSEISLTALILARSRGGRSTAQDRSRTTSLALRVLRDATVADVKALIAQHLQVDVYQVSFIIDACMAQTKPFVRIKLVYDACTKADYEGKLKDTDVLDSIALWGVKDLVPLVGMSLEANLSLAVEGEEGPAFKELRIATRSQWCPSLPELDRSLLELQKELPSLKQRWQDDPFMKRHILVTMLTNQAVDLAHWTPVANDPKR